PPVDGHVTRGVFPLVVGAGGLDVSVADAPVYVPSAGDVAARWLGYAAALALVGGFIFNLFVARRALARIDGSDVADQYARRFRQLALAACAGIVVASLVGVIFQAANASDVSPLEAIGEPSTRLLGTR